MASVPNLWYYKTTPSYLEFKFKDPTMKLENRPLNKSQNDLVSLWFYTSIMFDINLYYHLKTILSNINHLSMLRSLGWLKDYSQSSTPPEIWEWLKYYLKIIGSTTLASQTETQSQECNKQIWIECVNTTREHRMQCI